jgi:gamma-glutamylcyclotransferase (GGCT)/AIG2-like uncharacterized protein YtfP
MAFESNYEGEMEKGDNVFVYGTLRKGERMSLDREFAQTGVSFVGMDTINGRMYHLGAFPGIKDVPDDYDDNNPNKIIGEVFRIRDASIIAVLDAYEGYLEDNPEHGLYDRKKTTTARCRPVWVYIYNHPVIPAQQIDSGDWCRSRQMPNNVRRLQTG